MPRILLSSEARSNFSKAHFALYFVKEEKKWRDNILEAFAHFFTDPEIYSLSTPFQSLGPSLSFHFLSGNMGKSSFGIQMRPLYKDVNFLFHISLLRTLFTFFSFFHGIFKNKKKTTRLKRLLVFDRDMYSSKTKRGFARIYIY